LPCCTSTRPIITIAEISCTASSKVNQICMMRSKVQ
jgi:hypothetical protein